MKSRGYSLRIVDSFPVPLMPEVLYLSERFSCAAHACACGCGNEVITPLSPVQWRLTQEATGPSLRPSIGNWTLPCRSHYWISGGRVEWAADWSEEEIRNSRLADARLRETYFGAMNAAAVTPDEHPVSPQTPKKGWFARLVEWVDRKLMG